MGRSKACCTRNSPTWRTKRPDLFDIKFVRDELFYYSRDENQFLRRRRAFVFVLFPDLIAARFKDPELPHQRIVMLQSAILALVRRLTEWLSTDAIRFEVLFVQDGEKKPLAGEATLTRIPAPRANRTWRRGRRVGYRTRPRSSARLNWLRGRRKSTASPRQPSRSRWRWRTWS